MYLNYILIYSIKSMQKKIVNYICGNKLVMSEYSAFVMEAKNVSIIKEICCGNLHTR